MRIATAFYWVTSIFVALLSYRFVVMGTDLAYPMMAHHVDWNRVAFIFHVIASPIAMLLAPFQLSKKFRAKSISRHRMMGRAYVLAVFIGGVSGFVIGLNASFGMVSVTGFVTLSVIWLFVTGRALWHVRKGEIVAHQRWMIRSIALTFAGVTLRLMLPLSFAFEIPLEMAYPAIAWACWVPNILVAEWWVRRTLPQRG